MRRVGRVELTKPARLKAITEMPLMVQARRVRPARGAREAEVRSGGERKTALKDESGSTSQLRIREHQPVVA